MVPRQQRSTRTDTRVPYETRFRCKGTLRTWECPQVRGTPWQRAGDCAESAPERAGYLPRRRPNRPVGFAGSAGSGGVFGAMSAKPVARLALTKSDTSATGMPLAPAISASVAGPFIIAVAMRKWRGYSRSVCGHLLSLLLPFGSYPGSSSQIGRASCRERVCQYV